MRKKSEETKNLKIVDDFQDLPILDQKESSSILEKVQFIGENYNFVQKEIQDIIARSKVNDSKIKQYRKSIDDLEVQLKKERQYTVKLVDECQELRAGHYQVEEKLQEAVECQAALQLSEKNLILELKQQKEISEKNQSRAEQAFQQARKLHKMVYSSEEQTQGLKAQLQGLRIKWVEEKKSWIQSHKSLTDSKQKLQNEYLKIEKMLQTTLAENDKIIDENRKIQRTLKADGDSMRKLESQLDHRQALIERRDRRIKMLEVEITDLHKNREQQLKQKTGQLFDQVESLKKICQRLRVELKSKQNEMDELFEKLKTYERIYRTEPEKKIADLKKNNDELKLRLNETVHELQKFQNLSFQNQENIKSMDRLVEEMDFLKDQLKESQTHTKEAKREFDEAVMQKHEIEQELKHLKIRTAELQNANSKLNQDVTSLQKEFSEKVDLVEQLKDVHQKRLSELSINSKVEKEELREKLGDVKVEVKQLQLEASYLEVSRTQLAKEKDQYFEEVKLLKSSIDALKTSHASEVQGWKDKVLRLETEKQTLSGELVKVESKVCNIQNQMGVDQSRIQKLQSEYEQTVAELNQEILILRESQQDLIGHQQSVMDEKNLLVERLEIIQKRYAEDVDRFEDEHFQLQQKLDVLMKNQVSLEDKLIGKETELGAVREKLREVEHQSRLDKKEGDHVQRQLSDQILAVRKNWSEEKQALIEKLESDRSEMTKKLVSEKDQMTRQWVNERTSMENQWKQEKLAITAEKDQLAKQWADERTLLQSQWSQERKTLKAEKDQMTKQWVDERASLESQWNQQRLNLIAEKDDLDKRWIAERASQISQWTREREILVADKVREISDLREANDELRRDLDDLKTMTEQASTEKARSWNEERQRLQDELTRLRHMNNDLKKEKKFESEYEDRLKNQYSESQAKLEELRSRELQISNYSRLVDEQKFKLRRFADELASEVTGLQVLNPLREYLELTKKEIRDVELLLSKTPALALERKPLEEHFEKLVMQRDQLQKSLDESKQSLYKKAKAVKEICRRAVLIPLPPLPPKENQE